MNGPLTLEQATRIAADFQHIVGTELIKGKPDTAIRYVVVGPYNYKRHKHFAKHYHQHHLNHPDTHYTSQNNEYDVLCIVIHDDGQYFIIDVRLLVQEYSLQYQF